MSDLLTATPWQVLTGLVNEVKRGNRALQELLFSNEDPQSTEKIRWGVLRGERTMAPLIKKNGAPIPVEGLDEDELEVDCPTIDMVRSFHPHELMFERRADTPIFVSGNGSEQVSAAERKIAQELAFMEDKVTNTIEYLVSQAIRGKIAYSVADSNASEREDQFEIDFARDASLSIDVSGGTTDWKDAPTTAKPINDLNLARRRIHSLTGVNATHALMPADVSDAFFDISQIQTFLDNRRFDAGDARLQERFEALGLRFLGRVAGLNLWEYDRKVILYKDIGIPGSSPSETALLPADQVQVVSAVPEAEMVLYYGGIADMDAFDGRSFATRRFSKQWDTPKPSQRHMNLMSRPLPIMRRPNVTATLTVS